ncbi:MAG: adenosylmethionine--8-amino-7-oxononanoate transaminase [Proteobacteria bacterium]|nr:adenosylmethionine--8-amino-7-oxononanoate transaminase [Pseudomonadota bacterium]
MPVQDLAHRSQTAIWHPCTQMAHLHRVPPLPIARGEGPWLVDTDGRRYFDANSSWWVNLFGHGDAGITGAIHRQLDTLAHVMLAGCTHEPAVRLGELLAARTGGQLGHTFFASDGASAIEIALKMSFHAWANQGQAQRREFVCLRHGYHGETIGALAVTDVQLFRDAYAPLLMQAHIVASPDSRDGAASEAEALHALRELLAARGEHIAAVVVEPLVQCAAGMRMHSPAYLRAVRELTREAGVHLIADEIAVGCGRTGRFFAWEHVLAATPGADGPFWPDFLTLSKGITAGTLPLSLVLTTDAVYNAFWSDDVRRGFLHSHSYSGNALACAAAVAVLERFADGALLGELAQQAQHLRTAFAPLADDDRVEHLRQRGTILAFDVKAELAGADFALRYHLAARTHGLLIRPIGGTVYLMPPYVVDAPTAAWLARAVGATLDEVSHAA